MTDTDEPTVDAGLLIRTHHLPHWQVGGSHYFITFRSARGDLPSVARGITVRTILHDHGSRYELVAAVVMPDHVHAILRPLEVRGRQWHDLAQITKIIKGVSARRINQRLGTHGRVWQSETFDRIIRDEREFEDKLRYMWHNPLARGLAHQPGEYPFWVMPENVRRPDTPVEPRWRNPKA